MHDAKLTSPSGIFLSPSPPSPSAYAGLTSVPTFEEKEKANGSNENEASGSAPKDDTAKAGDGDETKKPAAITAEEKSAAAAKARDLERERAVTTPTDFALDFGKGLRPTGSFDASNGEFCIL